MKLEIESDHFLGACLILAFAVFLCAIVLGLTFFHSIDRVSGGPPAIIQKGGE